MSLQLVLTQDGSTSFFSQQFNQGYHSHFGAWQESMHIFIQAGLNSEPLIHQSKIRLFEVGFGTGLNAFLTYFYKQNRTVFYRAVELYPLSLQDYSLLNYASKIDNREASFIFEQLHQSPWEREVELSPSFILEKKRQNLCDFSFEGQSYNLVYFDAFSPDVQPQLWTDSIFSNLFEVMESPSVLVTYCCKGTVKRALKTAGFAIEKLPGPTGKREILRAYK